MDAFQRRLERVRWFYMLCLSWEEFGPDYVGLFAPHRPMCEPKPHGPGFPGNGVQPTRRQSAQINQSMKSFPISLEIAGASAMWTRPDSGDAPASYPAPTFQAAKQIFESIVWLRSAEVIPWRVEICRPVVFHRYYTNYNGPLRKDANDSLGAETAGAHQLIATVLINVRYKLHAFVISHHPVREVSAQAQKWLDQHINGAHAYKDRFEFRLEHGQWHHTPFLGWKEFTPSWLGPVRDDTFPDKSVDGISLPSLLHRTFPRGQFTGYRPCFRTEWTIRDGVLDYFPGQILEAMQKGDFTHVE